MTRAISDRLNPRPSSFRISSCSLCSRLAKRPRARCLSSLARNSHHHSPRDGSGARPGRFYSGHPALPPPGRPGSCSSPLGFGLLLRPASSIPGVVPADLLRPRSAQTYLTVRLVLRPGENQPGYAIGRSRMVVKMPARLPAQASASSATRSFFPFFSGRTLARTASSISRATSGFSLRKLRTLSLPWPMRSPL